MIKAIVSFALIFFAGYGFLHRARVRWLAVSIYGLTAVGLYFVWLPDQTTVIAHAVGVGRGTDLVLYCWLLASMMIMFNLHLKSNEQLQMITELARALTLATANTNASIRESESAF